MKLFEPIVVDLYKPFPLKKVDMQQKNIGRGVIVTLTAGSTIVDPSDEDVKLWAKRPDGNISYLACTVQADGTIRAPFSSQMLSIPGEVIVSLEMISGDDDITTPIFKVSVGTNIADHTAAESQNEFSALQEALSNMNDALAEVNDMKANGLKGDVGPYYVPNVSTEGVLSWTNTGGLDNPEAKSIRGPEGPAGPTGPTQVSFAAYSEFPESGNEGMLYVDTSDTEKLMVYRWNGTEYVPAGVDVVDPSLATVEGFAADAYLTQLQFNKQNEKLDGELTDVSSLLTHNTSYVKCYGKLGILNVNIRNANGFSTESYIKIFESSIKPASNMNETRTIMNDISCTTSFSEDGIIKIYIHGTAAYSGWYRVIIPFIVTD